MNNNPSIKPELRQHSSGSLKDDGSQTPTPGSPTQTFTPQKSKDTQHIISPKENDNSKDSHEKIEEAEDTEQSDPAAEIEHFDWMKLEERYHDAIGERNKEEHEILHEWENLMNFFTIWAETTQTHEVERSFKRLRTRITYVQNSEKNLEATRVHYTKVVSAFESALALLNQH